MCPKMLNECIISLTNILNSFNVLIDIINKIKKNTIIILGLFARELNTDEYFNT